jgi:hypothetical protein
MYLYPLGGALSLQPSDRKSGYDGAPNHSSPGQYDDHPLPTVLGPTVT